MPRLTVKDCGTVGAAFQFALPVWLATIVQRPWATSVTVVPATEQTRGVDELKVTASVEVAEALSAGGVWSNRRAAIAPKVMV